jgi:hypothetical protein
LVTKAGYKNCSKGLRRLDQLLLGDLESSRHLIAGLPAALDLPTDTVAEAVKLTCQELEAIRQREAEEADRAWRASFKPHGYYVTERDRPSSITLCAFSGGPDRWLKIALDLTKQPVTFASQALVQAKLKKDTAYFGKIIGVIVNYSPDHAVRFDLDGHPIEVLPKAWRPGQIALTIGRRPVSEGQINALFGGG